MVPRKRRRRPSAGKGVICSRAGNSTTQCIFLLTSVCKARTYRISLAHRGASSRDDPEGGARRGVPRLGLVTASLGRFGNRPPGTMTRAARSSLHVLRRKCRGRKRGSEAEKRHGGAPRGAPPSAEGGTWPATLLRAYRVPLHPGRLSALRHPSIGVEKVKARAQIRRENETG